MSKRALLIYTLILILLVSYLTYAVSNQRSYSISIHPENLLGMVAGSTKDLLKGKSLRESLNVFSLRPEASYIIQAPRFELLPLTRNPLETITNKTNRILSPFASSTTIRTSTDIDNRKPLIQIDKLSPEKSIINIFCSQKIGNLRRIITGSGTVIHRDGTVLTNAHVAQFPLISEKNPNVSCMARYGSPAQGSLSVKTVYVSPEWVYSFGKYINTDGAPQTGKSDFALLKIEMPKNGLYPIQIANNDILAPNKTVFALAYPANILGKNGAYSSLYIQKENLAINRIYSVGTIQNDVIETTPSTSGQRGSSGGAILNDSNKQMGVIATVTDAGGSKTHIRAISIDHIDAELKSQSGYNLKDIMIQGSSDLMAYFSSSNNKDSLTSLLNTYLNSR